MVRTDNIGEVSTCNNFCFDHNRSSFVQVTNQKALHLVDWQEVWTCLDLSDATNEDPPRPPGLERQIQSISLSRDGAGDRLGVHRREREDGAR